MTVRAPLRRALARALARARRLHVASDFDGTLAPIVARPERAHLAPGARRALRRLARDPSIRLALLSGRSLADLERRIALPGVWLAGLGAIEIREPDGRRRRSHRGPPPALLLAEVERWCARFPGSWIERKGPVAAVHFRAVRAPRKRAFVAGLRRRVSAWRSWIEVQPGKQVLELRPKGAPDKARALRAWLGPGAARALRSGSTALIFFGDDENDEPVHALVRKLGGIAIAVGRRRSRAAYQVARPAEVVRLMDEMARTWSVRGANAVEPSGRAEADGSRTPWPSRPRARIAAALRSAGRS